MAMHWMKQPFAVLLLSVIFLASAASASAELLGAIGGIGGVEEETSSKPLFTISGEALFKEGSGGVGLAYGYTRFTRLFGEKIEKPSKEFNLQTEDFSRALESTTRVLFIGYGVTSKLTVGAGLPLINAGSRLPSSPTGPAVEQKSDGIGNISVEGKYQFSKNPNLAFHLNAQLPSGYDVGADYLQVEADLAYSVRVDQTSFHLQGGYNWTGADRQDRARLDAVVANMAVVRNVGGNFAAFLELNYQQLTGTDDLEGVVYIDPPTQKSLDLTPGFNIKIKDNINFATAVRISLVNDFAAGYDMSYLFVIGTVF